MKRPRWNRGENEARAAGPHPLTNGFSLLEMVIAVSVFSVMMAIVLPHILGIGTRAETIATNENERLIEDALSDYFLEYHAYPVGTTDVQLQALVDAQLLASVPTDPSGGSYTITDSGSGPPVVTETAASGSSSASS